MRKLAEWIYCYDFKQRQGDILQALFTNPGTISGCTHLDFWVQSAGGCFMGIGFRHMHCFKQLTMKLFDGFVMSHGKSVLRMNE